MIRLEQIENENKYLHSEVRRAREELGIISTAHSWCLSHRSLLGWTSDQVERMREMASLLHHAQQIRDSCETTLAENTQSLLRELDISRSELQLERTKRIEAERKLKQSIAQYSVIREKIHAHEERLGKFGQETH